MNEGNILDQLAQKDQERVRGYQALLDFYHGQQWAGRASLGEKRLTFNYSHIFIDKLTSYLMNGRNFTAEGIPDTPEGVAMAATAEMVIERVHESNHLEQLDYETEIDCAILGDGAYKVTWDEDLQQVRVTAPDVRGISAWWAGDDMTRVWKVSSKYTLSPEEAENIYGVKSWDKVAAIEEIWTDGDFTLKLNNAVLEQKMNPYGFIPFIIFPNVREPKQFWGNSDLIQITEPQRELNRALSQISHILELSGNPVTVLENVDESTDIAVKPGAVWNVPEDAKAYLLDLLKDGGLKLHIDYIEILYRVLHDIAETPRAAFGGSGKDLSGIAMQIELYPLIQKVMRKRIIRNQIYNRRNEMILKMTNQYQAGKFDLSKIRLRTVWSPILPADEAKLIENEKILVDSGIHSRRRAMDEVGVKDPEGEFKHWMDEEREILDMKTKSKVIAKPEPAGSIQPPP